MTKDRVSVFLNDTATTEIYTLSLHDALPISRLLPFRGPGSRTATGRFRDAGCQGRLWTGRERAPCGRSEEHTSELQSRQYLVCRLLLEKKTPARSASHTNLAPSSVTPAEIHV